jgi:hypothetical protein
MTTSTVDTAVEDRAMTAPIAPNKSISERAIEVMLRRRVAEGLMTAEQAIRWLRNRAPVQRAEIDFPPTGKTWPDNPAQTRRESRCQTMRKTRTHLCR